MPSYCDINSINGHSDFNQRLTNWKRSERRCAIGTRSGGCANNADVDCCLSDQELACYSSYNLGQSRSNLDANLQDIYHPETSEANTFQSNLETTMLKGIVWAMLGTTVLYYTFTKI